MTVDKDTLQKHIAEMKVLILKYQGAIDFAEYLLSMADDAIPLDELAQQVGGNGATVEVIENG